MNSFVTAVNSAVTASKKDGLTANGAVTRKTSGQIHLDLFAIIGSARNAQADVVRLFSQAYAADKALALRIALWARDIRGGAGERQAFRNILKNLESADPIVLQKLVRHVPEFGRVDDVLDTLNPESKAFELYAADLKQAIAGGYQLAAKWTPRKGPIAVKLRKLWEMTPKQYRKFLVNNTNVVETLMCAKEWSAIKFDKLPSLASLRYQKAFATHAPALYEQFKQKLVTGEAKVNASTLFPHNIVSNMRRNGRGDVVVANAQWNALPDFLGANSGKVLVMSDVSGSMACGIGGDVQAIDVSIALGMYTAERLKGPFKDTVLTFSSNPQFHKITGATIADRINNLARAHWDMSTDLQAAFSLVLNTATRNDVPAEDMPETIIVISDMEFNQCTGGRTNFGGIKAQYAAAGYKMPQLVFWNVNGRAGNNPVKHDAAGTAMVSGFSPAILGTVLSGEDFDPVKIMLDTVGKTRYDVADVVVA